MNALPPHYALPPPLPGGRNAESPHEALLGEVSTLRSIGFLQRGVQRAASVARLRITFSASRIRYGTAVRIGEDLLLTCHHVLFDWARGNAPAMGAVAWFNYQQDADGNSLPVESYRTLPQTLAGDRDQDWAVLRTTCPVAEDFPALDLGSPIPLIEGARIYIVQHPGGGPKKITLDRNQVTHLNDRMIHYRAETEAGSSGAPIFDEAWSLVAIHQGWQRVATATGTAIVNQGLRIEGIASSLQALGLLDAASGHAPPRSADPAGSPSSPAPIHAIH
ncbi:MAG: serine protease [Acidobacteriota bacterium]